MAYTIEQAGVDELGDSEFKVVFMYKDHNLETESMPNSTLLKEVKAKVKEKIENWEEERAEANLTAIKDALKTLKEV